MLTHTHTHIRAPRGRQAKCLTEQQWVTPPVQAGKRSTRHHAENTKAAVTPAVANCHTLRRPFTRRCSSCSLTGTQLQTYHSAGRKGKLRNPHLREVSEPGPTPDCSDLVLKLRLRAEQRTGGFLMFHEKTVTPQLTFSSYYS